MAMIGGLADQFPRVRGTSQETEVTRDL